MVKKASVVVLVVLGFILAACSSPQAAQANPGSNSSSNQSNQSSRGSGAGTNSTGQGNNAGFASRPISQEEKLLVGTLDLEATDQAVTAAQAKVLLPLWQQIKALGPQFNPASGSNASSSGSNASSSGSNASSPGSTPSSSGSNSSSSEMTAVLNQIQQAMTADQLKAIDAMHLTATDVESELTELGVSSPTPQAGSNNFNGTPFPTLSADQRSTRVAQRQTQAANGGTSGGGFGGFQGTPSPNGTPGFRGGNFGAINTILVDSVINLLTQRAGQ